MNESFSPHNCIFHLLVKTAKNGTQRWKQAISDLGVTAVQAKVLSFMYEAGEISASELGNIAAVDNATLTGLLDRLEAIGAVVRHHNPCDRRAINIRLTERGEQLAGEIIKRIEPANKDFLSSLSDAETATLKGLLNKL